MPSHNQGTRAIGHTRAYSGPRASSALKVAVYAGSCELRTHLQPDLPWGRFAPARSATALRQRHLWFYNSLAGSSAVSPNKTKCDAASISRAVSTRRAAARGLSGSIKNEANSSCCVINRPMFAWSGQIPPLNHIAPISTRANRSRPRNELTPCNSPYTINPNTLRGEYGARPVLA